MRLPHICGAIGIIAWAVAVFFAGYTLGWLDGSMGVVFGGLG